MQRRYGLPKRTWYALCFLIVSLSAVASQRLTSHPALDYFPSLSQDGRFLAFVSERQGNPDIWLRSLAAGPVALPRRLTTHPAADRDPALNKDGSKLLYVSHKTDPRGDVYLLDLVSNTEKRLTGSDGGEALPQWGINDEYVFYLKHDTVSGKRGVYRYKLEDGSENNVIDQATSFNVSKEGWIVYTDGEGLKIINEAATKAPLRLSTDPVTMMWPKRLSDDVIGASLRTAPKDGEHHHTVLFSRYDEDTNGDGTVNTDDASSLWLGRWNSADHSQQALFQLTESGRFHVYPAYADDVVYFADLAQGDIVSINLPSLLAHYTNLERAQQAAKLHLDRGQTEQGLLVLANISRNLARNMRENERVAFDFEYIETLVQEGRIDRAKTVVQAYAGSTGRVDGLYRIYDTVIGVYNEAERISDAALKRSVNDAVEKLLAIAVAFQHDETVYGQALIEAGRLFFLVDDTPASLAQLVRVDSVDNREIRAKALFTRGTVYRSLGQSSNVLDVFIDVIRTFDEDSTWAKRAVFQAIDASDNGEDVHQRVASLNALIDGYPELTYLSVATLLRIADLYDDHGEQLKALSALDRAVGMAGPYRELAEIGYRRKGEILAAAERYGEAAEAYGALARFTAQDQQALDRATQLMVLQRVRKADKTRSVGETRIAAKAYKRIFETHPTSVEAHRGYIETKTALKEVEEVVGLYRTRVERHPDQAPYHYGLGLALTYVDPLDLQSVTDHLQQAIRLDPSTAYFHQTLGWAYEQQERLNNRRGYYEQAESEYRIALALNDEFQFPEVESNLLLNIGNTYTALSNYGEAYRYYRQRDELLGVQDRSPTELIYRRNFGEAAFKTGRAEEAVAHYQSALAMVTPRQNTLKAQLLERIGLAHQESGDYSAAVASFSQALEVNLALENTQNLALLQRNIGISLYNLSISENEDGREPTRQALKRALYSYFTSLDYISRYGTKKEKEGRGLIGIDIALGEEGSQAARGFDKAGEEKLVFSYIAGTYEKLSEPRPARDYYLKKLARLPNAPSFDSEAATATEKAVVLNRVGVLSQQLGETQEALAYIKESLAYTVGLRLDYGKSVNLYNLSRLLVITVLDGPDIDPALVEVLVNGLDERLAQGDDGRQMFFTLTNTAFILNALPEPELGQTAKGKKAVAVAANRYHMLFQLKRRAWRYYEYAQQILTNGDVVDHAQIAPLLVMLKLNMAELTRSAGRQHEYLVIQDELKALVEVQSTENGWLWYLTQADMADDDVKRQMLLAQAFEELTALPVQLQSSAYQRTVLDFIEVLSASYVDALVKRGDYAKAFEVSEQLTMRRLTTAVQDESGDEFFLQNLGEYGSELDSLLTDMRHAHRSGDSDQLQALSAQWEELVYALYEAFPSNVAYLLQYPPNADILSVVLNTERLYLKIVRGHERWHGFIHDGQRLRYVTIQLADHGIQIDESLSQLLSEAPALYVSAPDSIESFLAPFFVTDTPVTRVSSFYDIVNGYHQRSLFHRNVALTGEVTLTRAESAGEALLTATQLTGELESDRNILKQSDVFVASLSVSGLGFETRRVREVRDILRTSDIAPGLRHSAILLNVGDATDLSALTSALFRAGFAHVVVNKGPYNRSVAEQFVSLYLAYLADLPADEAVMLATQDLVSTTPDAGPFILYGYAGMDDAEKSQYATELYQEKVTEAASLYRQGQYDLALRAIEQTLSLIDYAQKTDDMAPLTQLAVESSFKLGRYESAVFHQRRLLDLVAQSGDQAAQSEALFRLGILYSRLEHYQRAIEHLEQAIALWESTDELDKLAEGMATLGVIKENMGAYSEALTDFSRSFEFFQEMGEVGDMAAQYRRIGRIYYLRLARYEKANETLSAALDLYRQLDDAAGEAETLLEIGLANEKIGRFDDASRYYRRGENIADALGNDYLTATALLYRSNTAWFRGEYQDAFALLSEASQLAEEVDDAQLRIMIKNTRGLIYWALNETEKALLHLKQAVAIAETAQINTELASSLNNLGLVYRQMGDYEASLQHFNNAREIDQRLDSRWGLGYDFRNIGITLLKMGRLTEAEASFVKAEKVSAEINNTVNWVKALLELGNVNHAQARIDTAMAYYERAYEVAKRYGIREVEWRAAAGKASLLKRQGDRQSSFNWYADAVTVVEGMRASLKIDELRNSFQVNKQDLYRDVIALLIEMGELERAFNYLERSRARSFIDLLGNQRITLGNDVDQNALDRISDLARRVHALKSELAVYDDPPAQLLANYQEARTLHDEAIIELKHRNPGLSSFVAVDPLTQREIRQMLDENVGLLSYMLTQDKLYIWLLRRRGASFYEVSVGEQEIETAVKQFRGSVQRLEPVDDELKQLYALLIKPAERDLGGVDYLGIIPDGALHFLSFAALRDDQGYLVDRYPLFYAPSGSVLNYTFAKRRADKLGKAVALGNPDLGDYNYNLPLAELEARSIRWNYPDMDVLTGGQATKEWFVNNIERYGIVHLAAHGEFDDLNPLLSSRLSDRAWQVGGR